MTDKLLVPSITILLGRQGQGWEVRIQTRGETRTSATMTRQELHGWIYEQMTDLLPPAVYHGRYAKK